jgi:predicted phage terminase large subunit-like protein
MTSLPPSSQEAAQELLRRRQARASLLHFTTYTKPDYEVGWHHQVVCDAVERWIRRETKRLMIFMPPRNGKSELVSRRLPAYLFGLNPNAQIVACSYNSDLASAMNRDVQNIIDSPSYCRLFPETTLSGSNVRSVAYGSYLRNSDLFEIVGHKGRYRSAGVGGGITGRGFDYGIIDDVVKDRLQADSPTYRKNVKDWYSSTFFTRQEKDASILITLTRWHQDDLAGWLLKLARENPDADQWEVIQFPAIKVGAPTVQDPRAEGDPLWPNKYPLRVLKSMQATMVGRDWDSLMQQSPTAAAGSIFKRDWYTGQHRYDAGDAAYRNRCIARWISIDAAEKDKEGADFTATVVVELLPDYRLVLRHVEQAKVEFSDLVDHIEKTARRWNVDGKLRKVLIEDKSAGTQAIQMLKTQGAAWLKKLLKGITPEGNKQQRAELASPWCKNGSVLIPEPNDAAPWLTAFTDQLFDFPSAEHDDMVDAFTQIIIYLKHYLAQGFHARNGQKAA